MNTVAGLSDVRVSVSREKIGESFAHELEPVVYNSKHMNQPIFEEDSMQESVVERSIVAEEKGILPYRSSNQILPCERPSVQNLNQNSGILQAEFNLQHEEIPYQQSPDDPGQYDNLNEWSHSRDVGFRDEYLPMNYENYNTCNQNIDML